MQDTFGEQIKARREYLHNLIQEKTKALEAAPAGRLRCKKTRKHQEYYLLSKTGETTGQYITKDQTDFIRKLAQKGYDQKILQSAKGEYERLCNLEKYRTAYAVEAIYDQCSLSRKQQITPLDLSDEEYIEWWLNREFPHPELGFTEKAPEFYTKRNLRVRSKSEILISERLDDYLIVYIFEFPIYLNGRGWVYPDFVILNVRLRKVYIWEHMGKMDEPGYLTDNLSKIRAYERNGYFPGDNLILTFESKEYPLDTREVDLLIKHYLL